VAEPQPTIELRPASLEDLERELDENLSHGRVFVAGAPPLSPRSACSLLLIHPVSSASHRLSAEVVWVEAEGDGAGVGVMLTGFDCEASQQLAAFVAATAREKKPGTGGIHVMERVRGYSTAEQMRRAREAEFTERSALERVYGKSVWEALLQNQRISPPEVARIARKGAIPRPLVDLITGNPAWVASAEIRRALLTNPRLSSSALALVLAACSKQELELVASQTLYPMATRQAARGKLNR
jgi:hypothetical protein